MAAAPDNSKPPSSMVTTIVVILLLTLIGAGTGLGVGALLAPSPAVEKMASADPAAAQDGDHGSPAAKPAESAGHGEAEAKPEEAAVAAAFEVPIPIPLEEPMVVVPLEPMITNLAAPAGVWLRVEASLLASKDKGHAPQALAAEMGAAILAYIRTLKLGDIEGNSGFLAFRDDLDDLVRIASHGAAQKVLIKSLVVE